MGSKVVINKRNADAFRDALMALRTNLKRLVAMTKDYPIDCELAGQRFVFEQESDIVELIAIIDAKLQAFDAAA